MNTPTPTPPTGPPEAKAVSPDGGAETSPRKGDPLDVGPTMTLSTLGVLALPAFACAAVYFAARLIVARVAPDALGQLWWGPAGAWAAFLPAMLVLRPWKPRRLGKWPFAWLGHMIVCFFCTVLAAAALLYSAAPEARAPLGLTLASAHLVALLAEAQVLARAMRPRRGAAPAGGASSSAPVSPVRKEV